MRRVLCLIVLLLLGIMPAAATERVLLAPSDMGRSMVATASAASSLTALRQAAARAGKLRVIVGLRVPFAAEMALAPGERAQQRSEIASAATALRARFSAAVARSKGGVRSFSALPFMAMDVTPAELERLATDPSVISLREDRKATFSLADSTAVINAPQAWSHGYTGLGQTIAIIDTGIDKTHPFLAGKVVSEACYSAGSACPGDVASSTAPDSALPCAAANCFHGTHVAGIAAGKGSEFSGVARDATIIAIRVFNVENGQMTGWGSDVLAGLNRVYELRDSYRIAAANLSLGGQLFYGSCDEEQPAYAAAIGNLRSAGIATAVASGNNGLPDRIASPACVSSAISVGAAWDWPGGTCWGENMSVDKIACFSNGTQYVSLLAPGARITSSVPGGGFASYSGTSMATPHVAGALAVLRQIYPTATVADLLLQLQRTGKMIRESGSSVYKPRIDLGAAAGVPVPGYAKFSYAPAGAGRGTVDINGSMTCRSPCEWGKSVGDTITVTPTPDEGSSFVGWSGACSGTDACSLTLYHDTLVIAEFSNAPGYALSFQKAGDGAGSVSFSPAAGAPACNVTCVRSYLAGTGVTATAQAAEGSIFAGWTGDCSGTGPCQIAMTSAKSLTASFRIPQDYSVSYSQAGDGAGSVVFAPAGGSPTCNATCTQTYREGTMVTVTAQPADGSAFAGWSGACSGRDACTLAMDGAKQLTATFNRPIPTAALSYQKTGNGNGWVVFSAPTSSGSCDTSCVRTYWPGTVVTLVPQPAAGSVFQSWAGACSGSGICTLTLSGPASVTAIFVPQPPVTLTYRKLGEGKGQVIFKSDAGQRSCSEGCAQTYTSTTDITVSAQPLAGSIFTGWSGGCTGLGSCRIWLDKTVMVAATFAPATVTLTYENLGKGQGNVGFAPAGGQPSCSRGCVQRYAAGTTVAVTAQPLAGSSFTGWSGACTGTAVCKLRLDAPAKLAATFVPSMVSLSYEKRGKGQGSVAFAPAGGSTACTGNCVQRYGVSTTVKLTATAAKAMKFTGWGGACTGSGACLITMGESKSVTASFAPK